MTTNAAAPAIAGNAKDVKLRAAAVRATRVDGFVNQLTGRGVDGRDKRLAASVGLVKRFSYVDLDNWYAADGIFAKVVDALPDDMTREWVEFKSDKDAELGKKVAKTLRRKLRAQERYNWALKLSRQHGGAVVVLGVNDGQAPDKPLDRNRVKAVNFLAVLDRWQVTPSVDKLVSDVESEHFGMPEFYDIHSGAPGFASSGLRVHHTRIHRFDGVKLSDREARRNNGWGDSVGVRLHDAIRNYHSAHDSAAIIVEDFTNAVYKLKGLADEMESGDEDTLDALKQRLIELDTIRSVIRAMVMDEDEDFSKLSTTVTGLDKLIEACERRLTAESDMPHTKILGESPGGSLGQQGTSQERQWYDHVATKQEDILRDPLEDLVELLLLAKDGPAGGKVPANWSLEFRPLWQLDEKEAAEVRAKQAETDERYIRAGVLYADEVSESRFGGDGYSTDTVLDRQLRAEIAEDLADVEDDLEQEGDPPPPGEGDKPKDGEPPAKGKPPDGKEPPPKGSGKDDGEVDT